MAIGSVGSSTGAVLLDRTTITGPICDEMPNIVVYEIVRSYRIDASKLLADYLTYRQPTVETYNNYPKVSTSWPFPPSDYGRIALYVNDDFGLQWKLSALEIAYNWIMRGPGLPTATMLRESLERGDSLGNPLPERPRRLCGTILYRWCRRLEIATDANTELIDMHYRCLAAVSKVSLVRSLFFDLVERSTNDALVSSLGSLMDSESSGADGPRRTLDVDEIRRTIPMLRSMGCDSRYEPHTSETSIAAAVVQHNFDLTWSERPLRDYYRMVNGLPLSDRLVETIYGLCPSAYRPSDTFNPSLPFECYLPHNLARMAREEGLDVHGEREIYDQLSYLSLVDNFHLGLQPGLTTLESNLHETDFTDDRESIPVCYGSRSSKMVVYSLSELVQLFRHNRTFVNPAGGTFTVEAIERLKLLSRVSVGEEWRELTAAIGEVEILNGEGVEYRRRLLDSYLNAGPEKMGAIVKVLGKLQEVAMYMRSWKGPPAPFPVRQAPPDYNQDAVDARVAQGLHEMYKLIESGRNLPDRSPAISPTMELSDLLDLPLLTSRDGTFIRSTCSSEGLTIRDRLTIMASSFKESIGTQSCIRLSSNWLASSAYCYLSVIGARPDYQIADLTHIS